MFNLPRWGVSVAANGGAAHVLQEIPVRVGIECCLLAAGIDAPRVNTLGGEFHGIDASIPVFAAEIKKPPRGAFVLFTPGTLIATEHGQRPVETLKRGERVVTRDHGLKRITWIGRRDISYHDLNVTNALRPLLVKTGALGAGRPERDTLISRNHRFYVRNTDEFRTVVSLQDYRQITPAPTLGVSYIHFMCNAHEVVLANGAWAECLHPADATMTDAAQKPRQEILLLFPEIATLGAAQRSPKPRRKDRSRFET